MIPEDYVLDVLELCALAGVSPLVARSFILDRVPARMVLTRLAEARDIECWRADYRALQ
jgi:hypothetical protein